MMRKVFFFLSLTVMLASCSEYNKLLKSTDYDKRFEYAKAYFEQGKYSRSYNLLKDIVTLFKGTDKAEESLYLLARSAYMQKDYQSSGALFTTYYKNFPKGEYTELARYYSGMGYYMASPEPKLDQSDTYRAIEELNGFLDYYPASDKSDEVRALIFTLQEKLAEKELLSVRLYYNLGTYRGNNYEAAVVTARNALRDFPYTEYKEDFEILILRSRYQEALHSVDEKKRERFRNVIDEYYGYTNDFPDGKYIKEANKIFDVAQKYVTD